MSCEEEYYSDLAEEYYYREAEAERDAMVANWDDTDDAVLADTRNQISFCYAQIDMIINRIADLRCREKLLLCRRDEAVFAERKAKEEL